MITGFATWIVFTAGRVRHGFHRDVRDLDAFLVSEFGRFEGLSRERDAGVPMMWSSKHC